MGHVTLKEALMAVAYTLILAATIPNLATYDSFNWGLVPIWFMLVGYSAAIMKSLTPSEKSAKKLARVVWVAWIAYYSLAVVWPLPLHWYDSLVIVSLLITPDDLTSSAFMAVYYAMSAASYLEKQDALQVSGRIILAAVTAGGASQSWRASLT